MEHLKDKYFKKAVKYLGVQPLLKNVRNIEPQMRVERMKELNKGKNIEYYY